MIKKLVDLGIDIEFEIGNIQYSIYKLNEFYYIGRYEIQRYIGSISYEALDEPDIKYNNWNEIENYISNLINKDN